MRLPLCLLLLSLLPRQLLAEACLIESVDDGVAIRMCQQNLSIPPQLFRDSFCQPQIHQREFSVEMLDSCPAGAYGICEQSSSEGVAYRQSIHYYSDPDDAPYLKIWCEEHTDGNWLEVDEAAAQ